MKVVRSFNWQTFYYFYKINKIINYCLQFIFDVETKAIKKPADRCSKR